MIKILVARTDKAGDVILTTPIFRILKNNFPQAKIFALVSEYTKPLIEMCPEVDQIICSTKNKQNKKIIELAKELKNHSFTHAIFVHPKPWIMASGFMARIPFRTGRASNLFQFLLTHRQVQKRSRNEKHESHYNQELALEIIQHKIDFVLPELFAHKKTKVAGKKLLIEKDFKGKKPLIVHPGHGGSAHNLSPKQYSKIILNLVQQKIPVIISLGPEEGNLIKKLPSPQKGLIDYCKDLTSFSELAGVYTNCSGFIGGSTGPMHLAGALGLPVLSFFPPQPSMTPKRWGPANIDNSMVLMPKVSSCSSKCKLCDLYPCMENIELAEGINWIIKNRKN